MTQEIEAMVTPDKDERLWDTFCHLFAFSGYLIPFGSVLDPLIIWLIKKTKCHLLMTREENRSTFNKRCLLQ